MHRVFRAGAAILFILDATRLFLFIFCCCIIPVFADRTFKCDNISHDGLLINLWYIIFFLLRACDRD
jgi:hypothetical protein